MTSIDIRSDIVSTASRNLISWVWVVHLAPSVVSKPVTGGSAAPAASGTTQTAAMQAADRTRRSTLRR